MHITNDPVKNKINNQKHQIDLADVEGVFYDDHAITIEDRDHAEERFVTLGIDGFGRLLVGHTITGARMKSGLFPHALLNLTSDALTKRAKP